MKKAMMICMLVVMLVSGCTNVGPGKAGIKVNSWGSDRGVSELPLESGNVLYNPFSTSVLIWPTNMQTATWTGDPRSGRNGTNDAICWNTKDTLSVCADINFSYQLVKSEIPKFYVQFRTDDMDSFTHGYLHNVTKDAFNDIGSQYTFAEVNGEKKGFVLSKVQERVSRDVSKYGVEIKQFGFLSSIIPPGSMIEAINQKNVANQKADQAENELREARAQAQKAIAKAEGEAKANAALTKSISPSMIEWRKLENQKSAIEKWNGVLPTVNSGNGGMILDLGSLHK